MITELQAVKINIQCQYRKKKVASMAFPEGRIEVSHPVFAFAKGDTPRKGNRGKGARRGL